MSLHTDRMNRAHKAVDRLAADKRARWELEQRGITDIVAERDEARAEVERLREVIGRAHEQLSKHDYKGPKQISRALMTLVARRREPSDA